MNNDRWFEEDRWFKIIVITYICFSVPILIGLLLK